jgi:hypothetical protein
MTLSDDLPNAEALRVDAPPDLLLAFYPLHKAAFGAAVGVATGLVVFLATAIVVLHGDNAISLQLLAQYMKGYSVSWGGAIVGGLWAGFAGFVFGWFTAFCRNLVLAVSLFVIRTRAELTQTRDFLDHI